MIDRCMWLYAYIFHSDLPRRIETVTFLRIYKQIEQIKLIIPKTINVAMMCFLLITLDITNPRKTTDATFLLHIAISARWHIVSHLRGRVCLISC